MKAAPAPTTDRKRSVAAGRRPVGQNGAMTRGEQLVEQFRRERRAGDPRLTDGDRDILLRIAAGDLSEQFGAALEQDLADDELLGGEHHDGRD